MNTAKIAIITGASNGIGRRTALELARRGMGVVLTYHSNERNALEVVREIGQGAVALQLDLSRRSGFEAFAQAVATNLEKDRKSVV